MNLIGEVVGMEVGDVEVDDPKDELEGLGSVKFKGIFNFFSFISFQIEI